MRFPVLLLLLAALSLAGACEPRDLRFAAVPWGSDSTEVRRQLEEQGFAFLARANDRGDQLYAGTYAGRRAVLVARLAEGRLAKVEVGIQPEAADRTGLFRTLERDLSSEYGERDAAGAADGAAVERAVWTRTGRGGEAYLILEDRPELAIVISWESPSWHAEYLRRRGR